MIMITCSVEGCNLPPTYRGLCGLHYQRWVRHGDPTIVLRKISRKTEPVEDRFWNKIKKDGECWIWSEPDGKFSYNGKRQMAARYAYELLVGPLSQKEFLFHECNNKLCVNPQHLTANRYTHPILTHCARGHERSGYNLIIDSKTGKAHCRKCRQLTDRKRRAKNKQEVMN